jgi:hypothetical protein
VLCKIGTNINESRKSSTEILCVCGIRYVAINAASRGTQRSTVFIHKGIFSCPIKNIFIGVRRL